MLSLIHRSSSPSCAILTRLERYCVASSTKIELSLFLLSLSLPIIVTVTVIVLKSRTGPCSPVEIPLMTLERLRSIAIFGAMFESASIGAMQLWQPIGNEVQKNDLDRHFTSEHGIDMLNFGGACTRRYRSAAITPATLLPTDLSGISAGYRTHHWVTRPTGYLRAGSRRNFRREIVVAVRISNELNETLRDVICCQLRR